MEQDPINREREAAFDVIRTLYFGHGKIEVLPKIAVTSLAQIATMYTPGVGHLAKAIASHPESLGDYTWRDNCIAIVTDGTAVLGLGAVGPRAALPVMEGKAMMFKLLVGLDAVPLCLQLESSDQLVGVLKTLEPTFGGFNLEDVASPKCFDVLREAERELSVPVIHDDQYGTATAVLAGLTNAWKVTGRDPRNERIVVCGDGAAGTATVQLLLSLGVGEITVVGINGIITRAMAPQDAHTAWLEKHTNQSGRQGSLASALKGADTFIGLSVGGIVSSTMIRSMKPKPIVFSLANPVPEIMPEQATEAGAVIVSTGRFDYPNLCNNVLAFPALMRAGLDTKARRITPGACVAAARAIAAELPERELSPINILPSPLSDTLYPNVAEAAARALVAEGVSRITPAAGAVAEHTRTLRALVAARQADSDALFHRRHRGR